MQYGAPPYNNGGYAGAGVGGASYPGMAPGGYGGYANAYNGAYGGGYGMPYANAYAGQRQNATAQLASDARQTGEMMLSGMHEAMSRFARVSTLVEDVLRHLHMLFDAIFGLGYSIGAFREEARLWLGVKTGPVAYLARLLKRAANVWRLLCVFFMSPMAGRFSPVALVLRILGLVPDEDPLDVSLAEMWRSREQREQPSTDEGDALFVDSSNM